MTRVDLVALRWEARVFAERYVTDDVRHRVVTTGTPHDSDLWREMAARGWLTAGWPAADGGLGWPAEAVAVLEEELGRAGAPLDAWGTTLQVGNVIRVFGTPDQQAEILPAITGGALIAALGYTEADAGSDVAAVRTRARFERDNWVIDGEKLFTTVAEVATHVFLLCRTDPAVPKHEGLTTFLVPTSVAGFGVSALWTTDGRRTNVTVYDGVRIPDAGRVGPVHGGWAVLLNALGHERRTPAVGEMLRLFHEVVRRTDGERTDATDCFLGRLALETEVSRLLHRRSLRGVEAGVTPGVEGAMAKVFSTEAYQRACDRALCLLGPDGVRDGFVEWAYRGAPARTIYAGSSEVLKSLIAQRTLGLPRPRA